MKILAIGGSGGMGQFAVSAAQHFQHVEQIVVADLNVDGARGFADQLNEKVSAMPLDVSDRAALHSASYAGCAAPCSTITADSPRCAEMVLKAFPHSRAPKMEIFRTMIHKAYVP